MSPVFHDTKALNVTTFVTCHKKSWHVTTWQEIGSLRRHVVLWHSQHNSLVNGKLAQKNIQVLARAKFLLKMRSGAEVPQKPGTGAVAVHKFYSFEEDLYHHIREALMILSTGCQMIFLTTPLWRIGWVILTQSIDQFTDWSYSVLSDAF